MKNTMMCHVITIFIATLIVFCGFTNAGEQSNRVSEHFYPVDANETVNILKMISDKVQDNYKQIKTWEGKVESQLDYIYEGKAAEKIFKSNTNNIGETPQTVINSNEAVTEFSLDAEKDVVFAHNYSEKPIKYMDAITGRDLGAKGTPSESRAVLTKEYYIKSQAEKKYMGDAKSYKAIKQNLKDCPECQSQPVFDPRQSFNAGEPAWKTLNRLLEQIKNSGEWMVDGQALKVEECKDGNAIRYRVTIPGKMADSIIFSTMVFPGDKGFNITLFEATDVNGRIFQSVTWDYDFIQGVYLPKETTHKNYMGKNGGLSFSKRLSFKNSKINHSIPAETFTYKNLGLKNGDKFVDKIAGKEYKYQDANLVFVADINSPPK